MLTKLKTWARSVNPFKPMWDRLPFLLGRPATGDPYSIDIAMKYTAVYAAVHIISETIGTLSWHAFQRFGDNGRKIDSETPADHILHTEANPEMSSMTWRETTVAHMLMWGNGYSEIERSRWTGLPVAVWPLPPDRVTPKRFQDGTLYYEVQQQDGGLKDIPARDIFHLRGLSFDGLIGYSVLALAKEAVALGLAAEKFGGGFFGRGIRPSGFLQYDGVLSPKAFKKIKESIDGTGGLDNATRPLVLDGGMKWVNLSIPPTDAQFLETRKFQRRDIAMIFRVPLSKMGDMEESAVKANIEQENIAFATDCIAPTAARFEQEADRKLLPGPKGKRFTKMQMASLLRGDVGTRFKAYKIAREIGLYNINELRAFEEMNPVPGLHGTQYIVPANFTTAKGIEEMAKPQAVAAPPKGAPPKSNEGDPESRSKANLASESLKGAIEGVFKRCRSREEKAVAQKWKSIGGGARYQMWLSDWMGPHVTSMAADIKDIVESAAIACGGGEESGPRAYTVASNAMNGYCADMIDLYKDGSPTIMEVPAERFVERILEQTKFSLFAAILQSEVGNAESN